MRPLRVAIFASGTGSNALALIQKCQSFSEQKVEVTFVLSDKKDAPVLKKAQDAGVQNFLVEKNTTKKEHENLKLNLLREFRIDWIFLAGYMRLLSSDFLHTFAQWHGGASQVVNIHPSLLPAYPGVDSIQRAFNDRVRESGVTLHLVDEGMDTGRILVQKVVPLNSAASLQSWSQEIHAAEHELYTGFLEKLYLGHIPSVHFEENK
ncbi:phosphoribosylglycinamide formyltransferase [Bdellovibrio sp. 22V]|uniref:phosphoribosylglycinamide formyltransferase n=1 Tax=Bdellovibrio TaxID=958 RepID=UPI0025434A81|nr:phosphoribosylglycinamide formyltransferase [Bdellovibrio sp. 22V]WII73220.1 phosphoribosylglycinamide formyltransferase [Bdellovibrio sp. 22V]